MRIDILLLCILFIGLFLVLHYTKEGFVDFPVADKVFVKKSQAKMSGISNLLNPLGSVITVPTNDMNNAIRTIYAPPIGDLSAIIPEKYTTDYPTIAAAKSCETAPNTCAAFDDPVFAANCGMSFDINGSKTDGSAHVGGLYLSSVDRADQVKAAADVLQTHSAPYDPYHVYQPTLGRAVPGTFGITKDSCIVVKEKVDCAAKQTYGTPNCTQCYTSQNFARVGPETDRLPSTLYVVGNGIITITSTSNTITLASQGLSTTPISIPIPGNSESTAFVISVAKADSPPYIAGYIEGPTTAGSFKTDIKTLTNLDTVTNTKPRISGTTSINGFKSINIIPGSGKKSISLSCLIPFSFLNTYDSDARTCMNGPVITKESSASFLESDPCFGKANQPGNYKLECLQSRWVDLGGTQQGTGYPTTKAIADGIQKDANGNPLTINAIVDKLSGTMIRALTGNDANNIPLSIPDWNKDSMYATGVPINTPCDGPGAKTRACAAYLYSNQGTTSHIGPTYFASTSMASKKVEGFDTIPSNAPPTIYNQPGTPLDPNTPSGGAIAERILEQNGIAGLKDMYNTIALIANDNNKTNAERAAQLDQAYAIKLSTPTVGRNDFDERIGVNQATKTYQDMKAVCERKGMRLCQSSEICDMSTRKVIQPELTNSFTNDNWIAVGDQENEWLTLDRQINDVPGGRYCKTHTEVAGGVPAWSTTTNPGSWERLAKCCSGDGKFLGRYVTLGYNRPDCLNLAQIAVYSDDTVSSNVITPQTRGGKSSGWSGDAFPFSNFVDGVGNSIVSTSCYEVPWIYVDLAKVTPIHRVVITNRKDCCQARILGARFHIFNHQGLVYVSNPVTSVNATYTIFPPDKTVYGDVVNGSTPPPRQKVYGNNGSTTCERYCSGVGSGPWNDELPREWNGARCDDVDPVIGNCYSNFYGHSGAPCTCVKTGTGWRAGGWAPN
jgi:hypothetical protein